jgi:hypothetical protein
MGPNYLGKFSDYINTENDVYKIIKCHLLVESQLIQLYEYALKYPNELGKSNFSTKLGLCAAIGLVRKDEVLPFKRFNILRNKIAHEIDKEITEENIKYIIEAYPPHFKASYTVSKTVAPNTSLLDIMLSTLTISLVARVETTKTMKLEEMIEYVQTYEITEEMVKNLIKESEKRQ